MSPDTQNLLDDEIRPTITEAHDEVVTLLTAARRAREWLLEHETLDEDDAYAAAGVTRRAATPAGTLAAAARDWSRSSHVLEASAMTTEPS